MAFQPISIQYKIILYACNASPSLMFILWIYPLKIVSIHSSFKWIFYVILYFGGLYGIDWFLKNWFREFERIHLLSHLLRPSSWSNSYQPVWMKSTEKCFKWIDRNHVWTFCTNYGGSHKISPSSPLVVPLFYQSRPKSIVLVYSFSEVGELVLKLFIERTPDKASTIGNFDSKERQALVLEDIPNYFFKCTLYWI